MMRSNEPNMTETGGCFCGAVRYEFNGKMMWPALCHCGTCQKLSGGGGGAWFGVLKDTARISGEPAVFEYRADSGNRVRHHFCGKCGAPVYNTNSMNSDVYIFAASSLDAPEKFAPRMRIFASCAPAWARENCPPLREFEGMPVSDKAERSAGSEKAGGQDGKGRR